MNRKQRRRRNWLGKRMAELVTGPRTPEDMAELYACGDELIALGGGPLPRPEPSALPPAGTGTYVPRRRERSPEEEDRLNWRKVIAMRQGASPAGRVLYTPEADAARAARIERGREHVKGLIPRSAMRQAR